MKPTDPDSPPISRRALLATAGVAAAGAVVAGVTPGLGAQAQQTPAPPVVPADPSAVPGLASEALSPRSQFEHPVLSPVQVTTGSSLTRSSLRVLNGLRLSNNCRRWIGR